MRDIQNDAGFQVVKAILESSEIGQAVIEVDDQGGNITLRGITASEEDKRLAEDIASRQDGVVKVINELIYD